MPTEKLSELPFEVTRRLLIASEDILVLNSSLPSTSAGKTWEWLRSSVDSLFLKFHGASRMLKSFAIATVFSTLIPLTVLGVLEPLGFIQSDRTKPFLYALWGILALTIIFAKPSRYALTGYDHDHVRRVLERLHDLHLFEPKGFTAIYSSLQRAEEDTKSRLTSVRWVAGSLFAFAILLAQKGVDLKDSDMLGSALVPLTGAALLAGFSSIHARATVAVYGLAHAVVHKLELRAAYRNQNKVIRIRRMSRTSKKTTP